MFPSNGLHEHSAHIAGAAIARATATALHHFDQDALIRGLETEVKNKLRDELELLIRERMSLVLERELPTIVREVYTMMRQRG